MTACRRAWFVGQRAQETKVPVINPFSRMGLKTRAPGQPVRETPTATWDELVAFRTAARKLGYHSVGTAALLTWEWLQREEHVFGAFEISHYRPKERPNSVRIVHPKNGEEAWWPLFDETGEPLFPELMTELDAIKETIISGLIFRRDHAHRRSLCSATMDYRTQGSALPSARRKKDSCSSRTSKRTLIYFVSPRWVHGRCRQRSHRCRVARRRGVIVRDTNFQLMPSAHANS